MAGIVLFTEVCNYFDNLIHTITPKICNSNELIKTGTYTYDNFRLLQSNLLNLEYRIKELKNLTNELVDNKEDIRELSLDIVNKLSLDVNNDVINSTEQMIENYSLKFQDLDNDVSRLTREMDNIQKLVNIDLAKKKK